MEPLTYRQAGVDIEAGDEAVRRIARLARATFRPEVLGGIGAFAGFSRIPAGYRAPVLVSSAELRQLFARHQQRALDSVDERLTHDDHAQAQ